MSTVIVSNRLRVLDPRREMSDWARRNLVLDNPDYYKKLRLGKWVGNIPDRITLYEVVGSELWIPFGMFAEFYRQFRGACEFRNAISDIRKVSYVSDITLFDYQKTAMEAALKQKNGIVVMPCGSGKTQTALEIVARVGGRCLWLTHTQDLLNQSMNRAKSVLTTKAKYGKITAGKVDIGEGITFATVQTMSKLDLSQYRSAWDIIIVDECQHCCGSPTRVTQFYKVISSLSARYKIGLTATPKRADGLEQSMFALLGDIIHEVSKEEVKDTTCPVKVHQIETGYEPNYNCILMSDGTINYAKLVDDMIADKDRYNVVFGDILSTCKGATIVLANRVEYLKRMNDDMIGCGKKSICLSTLGNSKAAKAQRKKALQKLNDGEIDYIFASYKLAAEGLDCPNLRYLVMATPEKDSTIIQQSTGRVARKFAGKECGVVIDFIDSFGMYKSWYKKRLAIYNKLGYEVL